MNSLNHLPYEDKNILKLLITQMKLTREYLLKEIKNIDSDELDFTPNIAKFETIGTLLFHIVDVENSWIFEHLDGQSLDFETWKWAFPLRLTLDPVQRTGKPVQFYRKTLEDVRNAVLGYLDKFSEDDLEQVFDSKMGKTTLEWTLFHIHRHEQHHIGQINFLRRLFKLNKN